MIGLIIVLVGIVLIIMGFLFTLFGSRNLSSKSADSARRSQQHYVRSDYDVGIHPDDFGEVRGDDEVRSSVKGGGVIMIGPIPVIFGSDRKRLVIAIILAIILMLLWFVLSW